MKHNILPAFLLLAALSAGTTAFSQTNGSNSPYSYYGLGLLNDRLGARSTAMAGAATALRGENEVNVANPASFTAIDSLTFLFDIGLTLENTNLNEAGRKVNAKNTSIDYVTLGFKAAPHLGVSLGMVPFSTVGYKMSHSTPKVISTGEITETEAYQGDGGLHKAYLGLGWEPFRGLSIGATGGYLWGDISHTISATSTETSAGSRYRQYETEVRSYTVDFGLQYEQRLNPKNSLTLGLHYGLGHKMGSKSTFSDVVTQNSIASGDTLLLRNGYELPQAFGVGLAWKSGNRLLISADWTMQKWGDVTSPQVGATTQGAYTYTAQKGAYKDMNRFALGAEYTFRPKYDNPRKHIKLRAGLAYTTPYVQVNGLDGPKHYTATLGLGIPIFNPNHSERVIHLNIAGQYERVEPSQSAMLKENHLRVSIGLSFNEQWFAKWKAL